MPLRAAPAPGGAALPRDADPTEQFYAKLFIYDTVVLGRSVPASFLAGLIYALMGYLSATDWPQMMNGAVWAPLVFLFLLRAVEGGRDSVRSAIWCGLSLGLAWLSGHHQVPLFLSLASAATWLAYAIRRRRLDWKILRLALIAFLVCGFVGALQILPAREYGMNSLRWVGAPEPVGWNVKVPYSSHEPNSMTPSSVIGIVLPRMAIASEPFVGFTAFTLALLALAVRPRDRRVRLFGLLGIGGFLYALGGNSAVEGVVYSLIPLIEKARTPAAAIFLFTLAAAVLSAYGLDTVGRRLARPYVRMSSKILAWAGLALLFGVLILTSTRVGADQRLAGGGIYALLLAALLVAVHRRVLSFRSSIMLFGVLVLLEASSVMHTPAQKNGGLMGYLNSIRLNRDLADYLKQQSPPFRIAMGGDDILGNWAAYHDLDTMSGYLASLSVNIASLAAHNRNVQLLWGARYLVAAQGQTAEDVEVFTGVSGRKVFLRADAFPRSWIVHRAEKAASRASINEAVEGNLSSFASRALMTGEPPALESCPGPDSAEYARPRADMVVVRAKVGCKGLLVVSDTFFPGWKAEVDGNPADLVEVNGAMRGVVVPAGEHTITMKYRPVSVYLGAFLTLTGIVASIVCAKVGAGNRP